MKKADFTTAINSEKLIRPSLSKINAFLTAYFWLNSQLTLEEINGTWVIEE